jgi:hypothetical protein
MAHARLPAAPLQRVLLRLRDGESLTWDELADRAGLTTRLSGSKTRHDHAAARWYSWMSPPRTSRRRTGEPATPSPEQGGSGGSRSRPRCGLARL